MLKSHIFCDVCSTEIKPAPGDWDSAASDVTLVMGGPGANDGKVTLPHVCYTCRKGIRTALDNYTRSRAPTP